MKKSRQHDSTAAASYVDETHVGDGGKSKDRDKESKDYRAWRKSSSRMVEISDFKKKVLTKIPWMVFPEFWSPVSNTSEVI